MANLTGYKQLFPGDSLRVDSSAQNALGARAFDSAGREYIYLQGTASVVANDWVVYDEDFTTTRLAANEVGPVAIAGTAVLVGQYSWFGIKGVFQGNSDTIAADSSLYIDGTAGRVDDLSVSGDLVIGAYSMTASVSNVATCYITYPHVSNDIGGASGGAPTDATYVVISNTGDLSAERALTGTTNQVTVTDGGAGGNVTLSTPQDLHSTASVTFGTATISGSATITGFLTVDTTTLVVNPITNSVGIGTASPAVPLDVVGSAQISNSLTVDTNTLFVNAVTDRVGIGNTAPAATLDVTGSANITTALTVDTNTLVVDPVLNQVGVLTANPKFPFSVGSTSQFGISTTGVIVAGTWSGSAVAVGHGGTGLTSATAYAVILGGTTADGSLQTVSGLGDSGQVLKSNGAGAAPTWQADATGGGGSNGTTISFWIKAGEAAFPNSGFPGLNKFGTTWIGNVLDYDSSATESAFFSRQIPSNITVGSVTIDAYFLSRSAAANGVVWEIGTRAVGSAEAFDANIAPANATVYMNPAFTTGAGSVTIASLTVAGTTSAAWAAGDLLELVVSRNVNHGEDDLAGDASLVGISLTFR